jgi:plastocyanin
MQSWTSRRVLVVVALGAVLVTGGSALAAPGNAPSRAKIVIKGGPSFQPNAYFKETLHFVAGTVTVRSGATVTLTNTTADPHTLSIVKHSEVPRTIGQLENCSVCETIAQSHGVNPHGPPTAGPPPHPVVDVGNAGFDQPGDSIIIGPKGPGGRVTFKVTAKPGTTLYFMCAIHPWMQGRFQVK